MAVAGLCSTQTALNVLSYASGDVTRRACVVGSIHTLHGRSSVDRGKRLAVGGRHTVCGEGALLKRRFHGLVGPVSVSAKRIAPPDPRVITIGGLLILPSSRGACHEGS